MKVFAWQTDPAFRLSLALHLRRRIDSKATIGHASDESANERVETVIPLERHTLLDMYPTG